MVGGSRFGIDGSRTCVSDAFNVATASRCASTRTRFFRVRKTRTRTRRTTRWSTQPDRSRTVSGCVEPRLDRVAHDSWRGRVFASGSLGEVMAGLIVQTHLKHVGTRQDNQLRRGQSPRIRRRASCTWSPRRQLTRCSATADASIHRCWSYLMPVSDRSHQGGRS